MADTKISALAAAGTLAGSEIVPVVQSSTTVRTTVSLMAQYAANPTTDDGDSLGTTALKWSDLFLASGAVLNFNSGDYTITHSADTLTFSGAAAFTPQALSGAGAIDLTTLVTKLTTTGADALTLADGVEGQIKIIVMIVDGGDGTLTPTNFGNGTTITFNDAGDSCVLVFLGTDWWLLANNGCTVA